MKKYILLFTAALFAIQATAQERDTTWRHSGVAGANMSQVSLSNWAAGGDPSIAFDLNFGYGLDYRKGRALWSNRLELAYGLNDTKANGTRKTNDKIYFSSNYGYRIAPKWYATMLLTLQTQFDKGYDYSRSSSYYISRFMAPGYLTIGPGLLWTPNSWLKVNISPATWRGTFVLDNILSDAGAFGVDPGKKLRNEFGANILAEAAFKLMENVDFYSRLNIYSNYLDKPQNIDVQWDIQVNMKINKWLSAGLTFNMLYDDDVHTFRNGDPHGGKAKLQIKETLGIGLQIMF